MDYKSDGSSYHIINDISVYSNIIPTKTHDEALKIYNLHPLNITNNKLGYFDIHTVGNCYVIETEVFNLPFDKIVECCDANYDWDGGCGRILFFKMIIPIEHIYLIYCFVDHDDF